MLALLKCRRRVSTISALSFLSRYCSPTLACEPKLNPPASSSQPQAGWKLAPDGSRRPAGEAALRPYGLRRAPARASLLLLVEAQHGQERLLRDVHLADHLHPRLAGLLPLQQLALAADVAAV